MQVNENPIALIIDKYSDISAHGRFNIYYLICLRHLIRSRVDTNPIFFVRKDQVFFMRVLHDLSYHLIKVTWEKTKKKKFSLGPFQYSLLKIVIGSYIKIS